MTRKVRIAHSPDSNDAFMFYALTQGRLDLDGLEIDHVLADIETLNQAAFAGTYEISALSFHGYAHLADRYRLMPSGASFGDGYGPVVVTARPLTREALAKYLDGEGGSEVSCLDLVRDLVGRAKGPGDLASNKKHLRGYGR